MMKKWIVEIDGKKYIERTSGFKPAHALVEFTGQIAEADVPYAVLTPGLNEINTPITVVTVDGTAKTLAESASSKLAQLQTKYTDMNTEVMTKMTEIFETTRSDSATATFETWKHMKDNAALYSGKGLKVVGEVRAANDTQLFDEGAELDTDQKIVDYATRKIELAHEYGVWRAERLQTFRNDKSVIENS